MEDHIVEIAKHAVNQLDVNKPEDVEKAREVVSVFVGKNFVEKEPKKKRTSGILRTRRPSKTSLYRACEKGIASTKELWQRRLQENAPDCPSEEAVGVADTLLRLRKSAKDGRGRRAVYKEYADNKWGLVVYPKPQLVTGT